MGYRAEFRQFNITFEDREGLEVRATSTSLGNLLGLMDLAEMGRNFSREDMGRLDSLFDLFVGCVKEWNLEHEEIERNEAGENIGSQWAPTPRTVDGLKKHEFDFVLDLVFAWMDGVTGSRKGPLEQKSSDGNPSLEASMQMETLSESPLT